MLLLVLLGAAILGGLAAYLIIHGAGDVPAPEAPAENGESPEPEQAELGLDLSAGDRCPDGGPADGGQATAAVTGKDPGPPPQQARIQPDGGVDGPPDEAAADPVTKSGLLVDGRTARSLRYKLAPGEHVLELRGEKGKLVRRWKVCIGEDGKRQSPCQKQ